MPTLKLSASSADALSVDAVVLGVREPDQIAPLAEAVQAASLGEKTGSIVTIHAPTGFNASKAVVVRLPENPEDAAGLRRAVANGVRAAGSVKRIAVDVAADSEADLQTAGVAALLAAYTFTAYKSDPATAVDAITIITRDARKAGAREATRRAQSIADAVAQARDWVNTPPADLRPPAFAKEIVEKARAAGVKATVWDEAKLARENCGGILGVGRGSEAPPRLVTLTYAPKDATRHIALVGKGITFDSGGLSLKPGASMITMKLDMAGAATIVAAVLAIASIGAKVKVTAYAALAENMPSGSATRPGDVLKMRNGKSVEVHNTDAEGRLVLADGLSLATESDADEIIDVATLTGACMVALGMRTAGLFSTDDSLAESLLAASQTATEPFWRLPLTEELLDRTLESNIADVRQHNPKPAGGAIFAASFLRRFVDDRPWAHVDIAGPSFNEDGPYDDVAVGGTGHGVRTLVEHLLNQAN